MNDVAQRQWWLFILLVPSIVFADTDVTYHCFGSEHVTPGGETAPHVTRDYTLKFNEDGGRYWDWQERRWHEIHSVDTNEIVLADETIGPALHGHWTASIDRQSGSWSVFWSGGQHTTSWSGHCKMVRYRIPPPYSD